MARIAKTEHPRILHLVDNEHVRVADVAAEYGCTPANIYALLGKLRQTTRARAVHESTVAEVVDASLSNHPGEDVKVPAPVAILPEDLFAGGAVPSAEPSIEPITRKSALPDREHPAHGDAGGGLPRAAPMAAQDPAVGGGKPTGSGWSFASVADLPGSKAVPSKSRNVGANLTKVGFGLVMRTAEGDENMTPFRSIDDLLSAVKPILRSAARSQDTIWFSIQPVDLATLEADAA